MTQAIDLNMAKASKHNNVAFCNFLDRLGFMSDKIVEHFVANGGPVELR